MVLTTRVKGVSLMEGAVLDTESEDIDVKIFRVLMVLLVRLEGSFLAEILDFVNHWTQGCHMMVVHPRKLGKFVIPRGFGMGDIL